MRARCASLKRRPLAGAGRSFERESQKFSRHLTAPALSLSIHIARACVPHTHKNFIYYIVDSFLHNDVFFFTSKNYYYQFNGKCAKDYLFHHQGRCHTRGTTPLRDVIIDDDRDAVRWSLNFIWQLIIQ